MSDYQSTTLTYNAENRLVEVKQGDTTIAAFTYDGDGCGLCTPEPRSGERGQRIVVRTGSSTLNWLVGDHLGSTTVTANSAGVWSATQLYKPWGEPRYPGGMQPGFGFTGQRGEPALGLYDYKARFYDPVLGRWIQSDSYVPDKGNPQGLDRYAYVANNPLKYEDSSGHCWGIASGIRGLPTYGTTCNNLDMALTIVQSDQASPGERIGAGAYIAAEGLTHGALVAGTAMLACSTVAPCAAAVETALGIGTAVCRDGDCTNEARFAQQATQQNIPSVVQSMGQNGEILAGIVKNTQRIPSVLDPSRYRIPDQLLRSQRLISEVKNVANLSFTRQIRDYMAYAQQEGCTFELFVRETTRL